MAGTVLSVLFATVVLFPFLVTFLTLLVFKRMGRAPISVLGITADLTTPFLLVSVYFVSHAIFGAGVGFLLLLTMIVVAIAYAIYERMNVKEFQVIRLLRKVWRLCFLLFASAYILLLMLGVVLQVIDYLQ